MTLRLLCPLSALFITSCAAIQRPEVLQFCAIDATTAQFIHTAQVKEGTDPHARNVEASSSCRTLHKVVGAHDEPRPPRLDQTVHVSLTAPGYLSRRVHYRVKKHRNTVVIGLRRAYTLDPPGVDELMIKTFVTERAPPCPTDCQGCTRTASSLQLTGTCYLRYFDQWQGETAATDLGTDTLVDAPVGSWPSTRLPHCRHTHDQIHRCKRRR